MCLPYNSREEIKNDTNSMAGPNFVVFRGGYSTCLYHGSDRYSCSVSANNLHGSDVSG